MKIGFDAKRYYHNPTGLGNYSRILIKSIRNAAPDMEVALYDLKGGGRSFKMGRMAAADGCGIFHGLSNELPLDIKSSGLSSVVTVHDVCWRTFPKMYHLPDIVIHDFKCRAALKNADCVVTMSQSSKNDIVRYYGTDASKIRIIYPSVESTYFQPAGLRDAELAVKSAYPEISDDFILSVGSINRRKNLKTLLEALALLTPENRPQLVVCSNTDKRYADECRSFAEEKLMPSDVIWLHDTSDETLKLLYTRAMMLVYPSFYEGFGLPVVEALLQKTPVITSNVSSLPEAAGPGAVQINPASADEIAQAISTLAGSPQLRHSLAEKGYAYCMENFTQERAASQYLEIYRGLV